MQWSALQLCCCHSRPVIFVRRPCTSCTAIFLLVQVTYGGVQSAHTAAVAAASAEAGMSAYLLLRGECPAVPAGNLLVSRLFGQVTHVTRAEYANRQRMVDRHVNDLQSRLPHGQKVGLAAA